MDIKTYLAQHRLAPEVQQSLQLLDAVLHDFGLEIETASLSEYQIYNSWNFLLDSFIDVKDYRLSFFKSALNYLMADDYFIKYQNHGELVRSLNFMKVVLASQVNLKSDLIAQSLIQFACFYGKNPERLSPLARLLVNNVFEIRNLISCVELHRLLFGGNLVIPGLINASSSKLPAFERRLFSILLEERSIRKTFPFLGLSKKEAHLFQYGNIHFPAMFCSDLKNTYKHYRSVVRLYKVFPNQLIQIFLILEYVNIWSEDIDCFERDMDFWILVFRFYLNQKPLVKLNRLQSQMDFIEYKRYNSPQGMDSFSLKGKTLKSLDRDIEYWHRYGYLEEVAHETPIMWSSKKIEVYKAIRNGVTYRIEEITDSNTLFLESKVLQHCVHSYFKRCIKGYVSIFGMRIEDKGQSKPCCTIEVIGNSVFQCKGKLNRRPNEVEFRLLESWCKANNFTIRNL